IGPIRISRYGAFRVPIMSYIFAAVISPKEKRMHASTRAIDLNGPADACLPRARERRTRHAGAATPVEVDRGVDLALVADVRAESRWCAKRVHSGLAHRVEHALF